MKFLLGFALLTLCACALGEYQYLFPDAPCKWGMTVEYRSSYQHYKIKYYVFGALAKAEAYNHNGDLFSAALRRPDFLYGATALYDGVNCEITHSNHLAISTYADVVEHEGGDTITTAHVNVSEYNGKECMVYYDNINITAYYVNMDGYLIAEVDFANDTVNRIDITYDYHSGMSVSNNDFTFSRNYIYGCFDERVFHLPDTYFAHCAASTTTAVLSVVFATLVASLLFVF